MRSHFRTRHTGPTGHPEPVLRPTHTSKIGGGPVGVSSVPADQVLRYDEQVPGQGIVPGSLSRYAFDGGIATPVLWQDASNPTLPDPAFPVGTLLFNTVDDKLYRNADDTGWSVAVDAADITIGTIQAGQIGAGQINTSHLQAGQITLYDENGLSVLTPQGWAGAWQDYAACGVYNGLFREGTVGTLPVGRTTSLPYWVVGTTNSGVVALESNTAWPSGRVIALSFASTSSTASVTCDPIRIVGGRDYSLAVRLATTRAAGSVKITVTRSWYTSGWSLISSFQTDMVNSSLSISQTTRLWALGEAPGNAAYLGVTISASEVTTHSASNVAYIGSLAVLPAAMNVDPQATVSVTGLQSTSDIISLATVNGEGGLAAGAGPTFPFEVDGVTGEITAYAANTASTLTPTVSGLGTATLTTNKMAYYKIGNLVFLTYELEVNTVGSGGGTITVSLPATSLAGYNYILSGYLSGFSTLANGTAYGVIGGSATAITLLRDRASALLTRSEFVAGAKILLTGFYLAG
jgi:hypothetical protein